MSETDASAHAARRAARRSMAAVERNDRDAWLANFAADAIVEDPIGASALDPEGSGHRGSTAIAAFWDANIGPNQISFSIEASYAAGSECANVGRITTAFPDGARAIVEGVFTYRVDEAGLVSALRAYWQIDDLVIESGQGDDK